MKILILTQNIESESVMKEGLEMAKQKLSGILPLEFTYQKTTKQFSVQTYANNVNSLGVCINPNEILGEVKGSYDVACLMFDSQIYNPHPTNPAHHGMAVNGCSPVQIPENWWTDFTKPVHEYFPEVLSQYFLHELAHYFSYIAKKQDVVHSQYQFPEWSQKQPSDFYVYLINDMKGSLKESKPSNVPVISKIEEIKQLQRDLKALGYFKYPFITGIYGSITKNAVRAFQTATGLVSDGIAGKKTLQKIEALKKKLK